MNKRLNESFKHIKRDALAGTITGIMAVPLSIGICLMSDYPVMTGLYTVILAGFVSFITYLFRPGNYTGMPGIAAGLAPALAMGVQVFGFENMPFVILLTSIFQAFVWKFKLERFILQLVPHYLVEGLLAGVGLKIALKFVPFLYDVKHESDVWFDLEREVVILLSILSLVMFVLLYKSYKKKMPALPYIVIMITSVGLSFFTPLPMITIDHVPFHLALPIPHFEGLTQSEVLLTLLKMTGFAMMLGTIDIIEQVMSNVAIEKMDPYKRPTNSNNSLLAIWISNITATLFGGMTNLDGLAKSTTNTISGAVTKLSNLFTSLVLLLVVAFPTVFGYIPAYALGVIMVYSGWKMISNIEHVRIEGRYALIMSVVCGLLVFEFGIFEGLLMVLAGHAVIQYLFMRRVGRSTMEIFSMFKETLLTSPSLPVEQDISGEPKVPVMDRWINALNRKDLNSLMNLYNDDSILIPAFSTRIRKNKEEIMALFRDLMEKDNLRVELLNISTQRVNGLKVDSGEYKIKWNSQGFDESNRLRFSIVIEDGKITAQHVSLDPTQTLSISHPEAYDLDFIE